MSYVQISDQDQAQVWRISRPERRNALGPTIARELLHAAHQLREQATKPRALVITAMSVIRDAQCTWIAGGDLKELSHLESQEDVRAYVKALSDTLQVLDELPLPVIMAIDGAAIGGGAELAIGGDLRLATKRSSFAFWQLKVGLATGYGSARRLVELLGLSRAQGLLYESGEISAEAAFNFGLVHHVVNDPASLTDACEQLVKRLKELDPSALAAQKRMLWHAVRSHPSSARAAELELFATLWRNPKHSAYLDAFEKRRPEGET